MKPLLSVLLGKILMRLLVRQVLIVGILITGCTHVTDVRVGDVINEYRANEVAALQKYQFKRVRIQGLVAKVGIAGRSFVQHDTADYGMFQSTHSRWVVEPLPYVAVLPENRMPGCAVCYFDQDDADDVVDLQPMRSATVVGDIANVVQNGQVTVVYLSSCRRER